MSASSEMAGLIFTRPTRPKMTTQNISYTNSISTWWYAAYSATMLSLMQSTVSRTARTSNASRTPSSSSTAIMGRWLPSAS